MRIKLLICVLLPAAFLASSCNKTTDYSRGEYLLVQDPATGEFSQNPVIACNDGETLTLRVKSNVNYTVSCRCETEDGDWVTAGQVQKGSDGYDEIPLTVKAQEGAPFQRAASVSLSCPEHCLGNFITLQQGYSVRVGSSFSFLKYGSSNPLTGVEGKLISAWTEEETQQGWTSTVYPLQSEAWCYGRNGFVQLGDNNAHGADLLTPYEANIYKDTVILVYFDAVAHTTPEGVKDNGKITVTVEGGGVFEDGSTTKTITCGNLDPKAKDVAKDMWNGTSHSLRITSGKDNAISANTRVRIKAGDETMSSCNRIYVKDFYLFKVK